MPKLENLKPLQTLQPLTSVGTINPVEPAEDKGIPTPITGVQARAQKKPKQDHIYATEIFVDKDTWITVYRSKWVKAYFGVKDAPGGIKGAPENNFYVKKAKNIPDKSAKPKPRKDGTHKDKPPGKIRGMRIIYLPTSNDGTPVKSGDLANHPQSKKNGVKYLTMRIPVTANLDSIAGLIKTQFTANTPKRFYTDRGTCVTIPDQITKADLGTHPGLVKGVQTGTR